MEHGITDSNEQQAELRYLALKRAKKVYLVVDYTKFNKTSFTNICSFDEISALIVDNTLDDLWHSFLAERKVEVIECE